MNQQKDINTYISAECLKGLGLAAPEGGGLVDGGRMWWSSATLEVLLEAGDGGPRWRRMEDGESPPLCLLLCGDPGLSSRDVWLELLTAGLLGGWTTFSGSKAVSCLEGGRAKGKVEREKIQDHKNWHCCLKTLRKVIEFVTWRGGGYRICLCSTERIKVFFRNACSSNTFARSYSRKKWEQDIFQFQLMYTDNTEKKWYNITRNVFNLIS